MQSPDGEEKVMNSVRSDGTLKRGDSHSKTRLEGLGFKTGGRGKYQGLEGHLGGTLDMRVGEKCDR